MAEAEASAGVLDDSHTRIYVLHGGQAVVICFVERYIDVLTEVGEYHVVWQTICEKLEELARWHGVPS